MMYKMFLSWEISKNMGQIEKIKIYMMDILKSQYNHASHFIFDQYLEKHTIPISCTNKFCRNLLFETWISWIKSALNVSLFFSKNPAENKTKSYKIIHDLWGQKGWGKKGRNSTALVFVEMTRRGGRTVWNGLSWEWERWVFYFEIAPFTGLSSTVVNLPICILIWLFLLRVYIYVLYYYSSFLSTKRWLCKGRW